MPLLIQVDWKWLYILNSPWYTLGNVDTAVYGASPSSVTRRQVQGTLQPLMHTSFPIILFIL